jgi:hypothetical protein
MNGRLTAEPTADKIMFEIYRAVDGGRRCCVVYFTELDERNREAEIDRALAGEHIYDGFIRGSSLEQAKQVISGILARLNAGEEVAAVEVRALMAAFAPAA